MRTVQAGSIFAFISTPGCLENLFLAWVDYYRIVTALRKDLQKHCFWVLMLPAFQRRMSSRFPVSTPLKCYRGISLVRNRPTLGPYSRPTPRVLWWF
jgi:hypothetical protein